MPISYYGPTILNMDCSVCEPWCMLLAATDIIHPRRHHYTLPAITLRLQGLILHGLWAQRPYYVGLLGYFEPKGTESHGSCGLLFPMTVHELMEAPLAKLPPQSPPLPRESSGAYLSTSQRVHVGTWYMPGPSIWSPVSILNNISSK